MYEEVMRKKYQLVAKDNYVFDYSVNNAEKNRKTVISQPINRSKTDAKPF